MSVQNSSGLASLTATYTDSEGEDDGGDRSSSSPDKPLPTANLPISPTLASNERVVLHRFPQQNAKRLAQLVSYHDDTVISDEEGGGGPDSSMDQEEVENEEAKIEEEPVAEVPSETALEFNVKLPPEPLGHCSLQLQEKIMRLHDRMRLSGNLDMNKVIQGRKDFRNPSIYEKLIQFCGINELGTNYAPEIYDPLRWGKESFYEELAKVQKGEMDRREKERKEKTKVEFVSGTAKRPGAPGSGAEDDAKRRKSKWDQVGGPVSGSIPPPVLRPVGLMQQPSLTTSATGTKGTVISAFGSLPKKPK